MLLFEDPATALPNTNTIKIAPANNIIAIIKTSYIKLSAEKNIYVVEGSSYPDVKKGNLIIAAHSGTGWKAFFNDLYKLTNGDIAVITYKNKKYTYRVTNIYKQPKTGRIAIYRNYEKTTLTLVTCTNHDLTTQTVYIAELVNVESE